MCHSFQAHTASEWGIIGGYWWFSDKLTSAPLIHKNAFNIDKTLMAEIEPPLQYYFYTSAL